MQNPDELRQRTLTGFLFPIIDLVFRSLRPEGAPSPLVNGHLWEAKLIALECANFIVSRVEEDIEDQDAAPAAQVAAPVAPVVVDLVSDEEEPAPPVIPSPEFNSGEEDDVAAPPTPSTEEEEDYFPPTPPSEETLSTSLDHIVHVGFFCAYGCSLSPITGVRYTSGRKARDRYQVY